MEEYRVGGFEFDRKEMYDRAVKEERAVRIMRGRFKLSDVGTAQKVYVKAVEENLFSTIVGYEFLLELRSAILSSGKGSEKKLPPIPVRGGDGEDQPAVSGPSAPSRGRSEDGGRYQRMYEGQRLLNKRLKVILFALFAAVAGFLVIDLNSEYSVFTYFTDYKAKMEEELIDKYKGWENELRLKEEALSGAGESK